MTFEKQSSSIGESLLCVGVTLPYLEKCEIISPQPGGSLLNEKVVQYELRQAGEIWVGDISPNGMLASLIDNLLQQEARGVRPGLP